MVVMTAKEDGCGVGHWQEWWWLDGVAVEVVVVWVRAVVVVDGCSGRDAS